MDLNKVRPIIRNWEWLYNLINYNYECLNLKPEEEFIHYLKDDFGWTMESWLLNIIKSKKLIILNSRRKRMKIIAEDFCYTVYSEAVEKYY